MSHSAAEDYTVTSASHGDLSSTSKIAGKLQFIKHIGSGSFGEIYSGVDLNTNQCVAIKVESNKVPNPQLQLEYTIYSKYLKNVAGFPQVSCYSHTRKHHFFAMTLLGHNLEFLFEKCGRNFSQKTLLMLSDQLINRVATLHERTGFLHR